MGIGGTTTRGALHKLALLSGAAAVDQARWVAARIFAGGGPGTPPEWRQYFDRACESASLDKALVAVIWQDAATEAENDRRWKHLTEQLRSRTEERDAALVERDRMIALADRLKRGTVTGMAATGVPTVHIANATIAVTVNIGADEARVSIVEDKIMSLEESVDGVRAEFDSFKSDVTAKLQQLQAAVDANDPAAVQARIDELLADVQGAHSAVGDADGDGNPSAPVVDSEPAPE